MRIFLSFHFHPTSSRDTLAAFFCTNTSKSHLILLPVTREVPGPKSLPPVTMRKTWKRVHLCSTNDLPEHNDKIKAWIEHAGGKFSLQLNKRTTHLLCSPKSWERRSELGNTLFCQVDERFRAY